jgi:hypothetical protein
VQEVEEWPMKRLLETAAIGMLFFASTAAWAVAGQAGASSECNRACLMAIADSYLAALVAHDPSKAPMAPNAKFSEQAQMLPVGEGLWKSAVEGPTTFKIPVPDPVAGQIGLIVMMKASAAAFPAPPGRGGAPPAAETGPANIQLALRLKVQNRQITEAEHVIARIAAPSQLNALKTPRAGFMQTVPKAERNPRSIMLVIANAYYDALVLGDGELAPFADDCGRRENGMHTAGVGRPADAPPPPGGFGGTPSDCAGQLTARAMTYIGSIDLRRIRIADEEKGLVFAYSMFRHPMEQKSITILNKDGTTVERPMNFNPFDLEAAHIFKISGGKIHEIEAMGFTLPLHSRNGWSPFMK